MIRAIVSWVEHRTSLSRLKSALLLERIPGGAKWRYVWGSTLSFVFALQLITGVLLMTAYSPSSSSAWGSVYFIQYQMDFGWLIRGLHHFGSQTMVVLLCLHMLQVVIAGAHLPPREVNWWLGLLLMGCVLGLGLTGYLLPWDQKGYWATRVATSIASGVPLVGGWLQKIIVGGPEYGTPTLTRFFALHVAILPGLMIVLLIAHLALFRRHGVTFPGYPKEQEGMKASWFWPEQAFRDMLVCLVIFGIMLFMVFNGHSHPLNHGEGNGHGAAADEQSFYVYWAKAGQRGLGANLDAPADPSSEYDPRPEWYYLFLFQLLKYFPKERAIIATLIIPGAVTLILILLPFLGYGKMRRFGHALGTIFVVALFASGMSLTCLALAQDTPHEVPHVLLSRIALIVIPAVAGILLLHLGITSILGHGGLRAAMLFAGAVIVTVLVCLTGGLIFTALTDQVPERVAEVVEEQIDENERADKERSEEFAKAIDLAEQYQQAVDVAAVKAERAIELAQAGIPKEGAVLLLQRDPKTQFKGLFMTNCAICHSYGEFTKAAFKTTAQEGYEKAEFAASDLAGFGSKDWIYNFLLDPSQERFYGRTFRPGKKRKRLHFTTMAGAMENLFYEAKAKAQAENKDVEKAEQAVKKDLAVIAEWLAAHPAKTDPKEPMRKQGFSLFKQHCARCHTFAGMGGTEETAPDLTGYGSALWLHRMLRSPGHPKLYAEDNLMPAFMPEGSPTAKLNRQDYRELLKAEFAIEDPDILTLSDIERELIVRYFVGDYRIVFGGREITAVQKNE